MRTTFLVISFEDEDQHYMETKYIEAATEKEAISKSGFSDAIAILASISTSTRGNRSSKRQSEPTRVIGNL